MFVYFYCTCFSDNFLSEFEKSENKKIFFKKMIFQIWIKSYPKNMSINFLPNMFTDFLGHVFRITFYPNLKNQKIKNIFQKDDFSNLDKKLSEKHVYKFFTKHVNMDSILIKQSNMYKEFELEHVFKINSLLGEYGSNDRCKSLCKLCQS